jgi:ADP-heptose:LPS heptosyltransferase
MGLNILSFPDLNFKDDLDSWLSLACACDGIVSISTSIVHFAGAAGQKVVVLLPETQGPYIWGVQDRRSIIYRNVEVLRAKGSESLRTLIETAASRIKGPAG